jgi:5-methylcytosine-specific restriction endonuclease McrA
VQPSPEAGKVCTKCGIEKPRTEFNKHPKLRDGLRPSCRECDRQVQRAHYAAKGEEVRAKNREFYAQNREAMRERIRQHTAKNHDAKLAYMREYNAANAERIRAYAKEYRQRFPDYTKAKQQEYRARELAAGGCFTAQEWRDLCDLYNHTCLCCGKKEPEVTLGPDHVVPLSRGGSNDIGNIQPLCFPCNNRKRARIIDYRPAREQKEAVS